LIIVHTKLKDDDVDKNHREAKIGKFFQLS
jgi:hypothetical protein